MSKLDESTLGLQLSKLMKNKLGPLLEWRVPDIQDVVGPFEPSVFERYDQRRRDAVIACQNKLRSYSDEALLVLIERRRDDPDKIVNDWIGFLRDEIRPLAEKQPPWYAGGFGHPDHVADFDFWAKMTRLDVAEVLCLSVGIEPSNFEPKALEKLEQVSHSELDPPLRFLVRRYEQLKRQFYLRGRSVRVSPAEFLKWARKVEFKVHPEFLRHLERYHDVTKTASEKADLQKRPDRREIDKIAQLFAAMAIDTLGYDPTAKRSPIPKEITDLAASMGLEISEDTVRKYPKLGANFLPEDWKPT